MAEVDVKNQSSSNQQTKQSGNQGASAPVSGSTAAASGPEAGDLQRQGSSSSSDLSRRGGTDPFGSWTTPADFWNANPFTLMRRMGEEMDRTFNQVFGRGAGSSTGASAGWFPSIDVSERDGQLYVHAELPGLKPEDVKVEIANEVLTISGERRSEHEHHLGKAYRSERRYGQFYREIPLPDGVNADGAKAQFRDGVLEVTVPVPQQAGNRRQIPVQAAAGAASSEQASSSTAATRGKGPGSEGSAPNQTSTAAGAGSR